MGDIWDLEIFLHNFFNALHTLTSTYCFSSSPPTPTFLQEISNYLIHQIYSYIGIKWHSLMMLSSLMYSILISFLISNFVHLCVHFLNQFTLAYQYSKKKWSLIKFTNCTEISIASFFKKIIWFLSFLFFLFSFTTFVECFWSTVT